MNNLHYKKKYLKYKSKYLKLKGGMDSDVKINLNVYTRKKTYKKMNLDHI